MNSPKILLLDVETSPSAVYVWGCYDQNINPIQVIKEGYMLCWSAKWLGSKEVMFDSIFNYKSYFKKNPSSDLQIAKSLWKLLNECDICITHNGNDFDLKWANTIFLKNGLKPPSSFKSIDTLKEARTNFKFLSNKLEFLVKDLSLGEKMQNEGFSLWLKCMQGELNAWKSMEQYNKRDVLILEKLYNIMKPFIKSHPKLGLYFEDLKMRCNNCASSNLQKHGFAFTSGNKYQRYICNDCGVESRGKKSLLSKEKIASINPSIL